MKKLGPNDPCPCGSGEKYKKCCALYHKGAKAPDALSLMKSRYSAYAAGDARYIIRTTHPENPDYNEDRKAWREEILGFCRANDFLGLEILEFSQQGPDRATVRFVATLSGGLIQERSLFLLVDGAWLYHSALELEAE
jgi:SEC-C motif-containing protein